MHDRRTAMADLAAAGAVVPAVRPSSPSSTYIAADEVIPPLGASLALVRPVGMGKEAAAEWLAVAASELAGYNRASVLSALAEARKRCSHHGQIVPFVIKHMEDQTPWRMGKPLDRQLPAPEKREALPVPAVRQLIDRSPSR